MFCSNCGKEISSEMKFCPICGKEIETSQKNKNVETQASNDNKDKSAIIKGLAAFLIFFVLVLFFWAAGSNETVEVGEYNPKCPSNQEIEEDINFYKKNGAIYKIDGYNVWITPQAEQILIADQLEALGYITACYSVNVKGYETFWTTIKSAKTNKTIAEYSKYGLKMKK